MGSKAETEEACMTLTVEFTASDPGDFTVEIDLQDMHLDNRRLPFPTVQLDHRVRRHLEEALLQIGRLLPKDWGQG